MPRVRALNPQNPRKAIILYCMAVKGWNDTTLEKKLGICHATKSAKMGDIDRFTLGEISEIIRGVYLSPWQISTLLGGVLWESSGVYRERFDGNMGEE